MKKRFWIQIWQRLVMGVAGVLLALGIAIGYGGGIPVQAEGEIPISSVEDFMNMESNPTGSYYLTKDITLPQNMRILFSEYNNPFTGTLDGKGHKLEYTFQSTVPDGSWVYASIFGRAQNATFKNLSIVNNIDVDSGGGSASVFPLLRWGAENSKFDKIKVSGTITVRAGGSTFDGSEVSVCGLADTFDCKLTDCSSSVNIKVSTGYTDSLMVGGLATSVSGEKGTMKNCSFSGEISASVKNHTGRVSTFTAAGISAEFSSDTKISGCNNSGNITIKAQEAFTVAAYGIGGGYVVSMSSCGNTGKIKAAAADSGKAEAAGLICKVSQLVRVKTDTLTKCWNKGSVSATGDVAQAGGICLKGSCINQCYNKGAVSASCYTRGDSDIGGLCVSALRMRNCYNVGKVTLKGSGYAGGLASLIKMDNGDSTANYSTGAVSVKSGYAAALFPNGEGVKAIIRKSRCYVYNNYYKASKGCTAYSIFGKGYGSTKPRAEKVSSITRNNCPKLSSKYWTYSSKYKRMVLKNNKEK